MAIDRRQLIVEAAHKSFSLFGYKATTMDQVAKVANVGKGTIYTFFKNKEELFDEIISSLIREMRAAAEEVMDENQTFHENANHLLFTLLEYQKEHQLTIKLLQEGREMGTREVVDVLNRLEEMVVQYVKEIVQKAVDKREIEPCNPELTAFVMLKLYVALIFDWEKSHKPLNQDEIFQVFKQYLINGLST